MPWAQTEAGPVVEPVGLLGRQEGGSKRPRSSLVAGGGRSSPPFVLLFLRIYRRRFLQSPNPTPGDGVLLPPPFTTPHAASASASSLTKARRGFHGLAVCGFQWRRRFRGTTDRCLPTASSSAPRPLSAVHDV
uniref:Uncharacterized protein n=1 Tax=Setaria viridis TaxID=4556 RepID=A0A4U6W808_SETVI|nr:hypothetical protein SEVIR_1G015650v2 [Setaria viridis]